MSADVTASVHARVIVHDFCVVARRCDSIEVLGQAPVGGFPWILWAAASFTLFSAFQYLSDGIHQLEKTHAHEKHS